MASAPHSEDLDRPPARDEYEGPWNQPEIQAARQHQSHIKIGELPARAAPIGQPFVRGNRKLQALLITPEAADPGRDEARRAARERAVARRNGAHQAQAEAAVRTPADAGLTVFEPPPVPFEQAPARRGRRWPLIATAVAFACSVGIPVALHASAPSASRTTTGRAPAVAVGSPKQLRPAVSVRAQAIAWAGHYLPKQAVIVTDEVSAAGLRTAGFAGAEIFGQVEDVPLQTVDYVLNVPGAGPTTGGPSGRDALVASSVPLAEFGTGAQVAGVGEYFPAGPAEVTSRLRQDEALRRQGGAELAVNPALVLDSAGEAILATGGLDLRAQNVVNILAAEGKIYVTLAAPVAAEARLDRPIRTITVTTADPVSLQNSLAAMVAPYKPDSVTAISDRKYRLTWNPAIAPVLTVG